MVPYNVSINRHDGYVVISIVINFSLLTNDVLIFFVMSLVQKSNICNFHSFHFTQMLDFWFPLCHNCRNLLCLRFLGSSFHACNSTRKQKFTTFIITKPKIVQYNIFGVCPFGIHLIGLFNFWTCVVARLKTMQYFNSWGGFSWSSLPFFYFFCTCAITNAKIMQCYILKVAFFCPSFPKSCPIFGLCIVANPKTM
jgi:hypothetical protein